MADYAVWYRSGGLGTGADATQLVASTELVNRGKLKFHRGVSRIGQCTFDLYGLVGATAPAPGDYLEIRYGAAVAWSGVIREPVQDREDTDLWHVIASDPMEEVQRREIYTKQTYSSTNERTVVLDVLSEVGITTTSEPWRVTTNSILDGGNGNSIDTHELEYDNPFDALRALAIAYNRELVLKREQISGRWFWVIYYVSKATGPNGNEHSVVQQTLTAGGNSERMRDITDDWEKADRMDVVASGGPAIVGTSGAGGTTTPRGTVSMRRYKSASVAGSAASTLQTAYGSNRRVIVAQMEYAAPLTDGGIDLGYLVTCVDEAAANLGNFRAIYLEVDEEFSEGWFSRATLIGSSVPALPSLVKPGGARGPAFIDPDEEFRPGVLPSDVLTFSNVNAEGYEEGRYLRMGPSSAPRDLRHGNWKDVFTTDVWMLYDGVPSVVASIERDDTNGYGRLSLNGGNPDGNSFTRDIWTSSTDADELKYRDAGGVVTLS